MKPERSRSIGLERSERSRRRSDQRNGIFLLSAVLLFGCGGGLERVAFATDLLDYKPGGRVGLSLVNTGATKLGINLCLSRVVSEDGKTAGPADQEMCALEPEPLEPGARVDARKTLSTTIAPGKWRYETTIRLANGGGETVLTQPFTVSAN